MLTSASAPGLAGPGEDGGGGAQALSGEVQRGPPGELEDQSELAGAQRVQRQQAIAGLRRHTDPQARTCADRPSRGPAPAGVLGARSQDCARWGGTLPTALCLHWLFINDLKCFRNQTAMSRNAPFAQGRALSPASPALMGTVRRAQGGGTLRRTVTPRLPAGGSGPSRLLPAGSPLPRAPGT